MMYIVGYLKHKKQDLKLTIQLYEDARFVGLVDANFASDKEGRKSITAEQVHDESNILVVLVELTYDGWVCQHPRSFRIAPQLAVRSEHAILPDELPSCP